MPSLSQAGRGILWYLKQATGEAKWDEYVERCAREGTAPMSRRGFERHRASHKEHNPQSRCC
jgi:Selenoprotein, putative